MATGNLTVTANVTGGGDGSWSIGPTTRTVPTAVQAETVVALTIGSVTVAVPTGATNAIVIPPGCTYPTPNPAWGGTLTLKGIAGDTGVLISNTYVTAIPWDVGSVPASFVLTSTASGSCQVKFF
jgi:hypothetical protein